MLRTRFLSTSALLAAWITPAAAQSIYLDFEDPAGPYGVPLPTYAAASVPGLWQSVVGGASNLVDVNGVPTGVSLTVSATPMLNACNNSSATGNDEALLGDRWYFDPPMVTLTFTGLQPGIYRVHLYLLLTCLPMFVPLTVTIDGAVPRTDSIIGVGWNGQFVEGSHYSTQTKNLAAGDNLVLQIEAPQGFCCYTQFCGLQMLRYDPPVAFCSGDGTGTACPCGNAGLPGHGCDNSLGGGGARLRVTSGGLPSVSADDIELNVSGLPATAPGLFFQGTMQQAGGAGAVFGDGLRCAGGAIVRLATKFASGGATSYPQAGDPLLSAAGMVPPGGGTRTYQVWYRNAANFCTSSVFNLSNGMQVSWGP